MDIGARIREARKSAKLTQQELAGMLGVQHATISGYENGAHNPKPNTLAEIARICNTTVDFILGLDRETTMRQGIEGCMPVTILSELAEALENAAAISRKIADEAAGQLPTPQSQCENKPGHEKAMYNLIGEMAKRKISINDLADLLGIHRNSVANKLYGKTVFTLDEALLIADTYFKDCDFRWLFAASAA